MYEVKYRELQDTVTQLAKVPDDEFIKPMYETLDGLNIELGGLTDTGYTPEPGRLATAVYSESGLRISNCP